MKKTTTRKLITQLDGMIAALQQAVVIGGRSDNERQACELLKDARLKLIEDDEPGEYAMREEIETWREVWHQDQENTGEQH